MIRNWVLILILTGFFVLPCEGQSEVTRLLEFPWLDLDREIDRQVVVDREKGTYLGHPSTLLLKDGHTILCVYPIGHGRGAIQLKRSLDGGRTWSDRLATPKSWETSQETPTLHEVVDATGRRRIILFSGLYPIRMSTSEDDGATWTELQQVGDWGGIVAMASVIPLRSSRGHYLALFHDDGRYIARQEGGAGIFTLYQSRSVDGGLTWGTPEAIFSSSGVHLCEPGAVRSPDGSQVAVLLRENRRVKNSHIIFSDDEGASWSTPREVPESLTGDRHVARYSPDGRLLISFRDVPCEGTSSPTAGDWVGWVGTYEDLVHGREGAFRIRFKKNHHKFDCAYPGLELLPDGTFVATTYGHWEPNEAPYILCVRFTIDELDRMRSRR